MVVSGRWLLGAVGGIFLLAAVCAYGTLALLFYQGQWQLVLHPAKTITAVPSMKFEEVHFDTTETGVSQLDGWWIPADPGARWGGSAVLYLHDGSGSLSDSVNDLTALHELGINVFAFDYRGFGRSVGPHPDEARMQEDAAAGFSYLLNTKKIDPGSIVVYGRGLGAALAAMLASHHSPAGLVLDEPAASGRVTIDADARAKIMPLWLLLSERFDPMDSLKSLAVPKLFLDREDSRARTMELYRVSASPKDYFELKGNGYGETLTRFFDGLSLGRGR